MRAFLKPCQHLARQCLLRQQLRFFSVSSSRLDGDTVGFIGLGNMGKGMADNLISKGHSVVLYDVVPDAVAALTAKGAKGAASPAEVS